MRVFLVDKKWSKQVLIMNFELFVIRNLMDLIYARYPGAITTSDCGKDKDFLQRLADRYFYLEEALDKL